MKLYHLFKRKVFHIDLGLERVKGALKELGNVEKGFKSVLISGTNGKGSTSAFLESLLRHSGFKVGLFTSPHLVDERERWQINRELIPEYKLKIYIEKLKPLIDKYKLTYFEASTILAFLFFYEENVDFAVLEVGLGGRFDATNVVNPAISIITNVSLDHTHILGDTLEKIAYEKLGIGRVDKPLVLGSNQPELINQAKSLGIKNIIYPHKNYTYKTYFDGKFQVVDYLYKNYSFNNLKTKLLGDRQGSNLSTALTGYITLMESLGQTIDKENVYKAVFNTSWKGRMELVLENPVVILDGAHNEDALKKTYKELKKLFKGKDIITFISLMKDKDLEKILSISNHYSKKVIFVEMPFDRGAKILDLKDRYTDLEYIYSINKIKLLIENLKSEDSIFLITGSLYFIGEVIREKIFN